MKYLFILWVGWFFCVGCAPSSSNEETDTSDTDDLTLGTEIETDSENKWGTDAEDTDSDVPSGEVILAQNLGGPLFDDRKIVAGKNANEDFLVATNVYSPILFGEGTANPLLVEGLELNTVLVKYSKDGTPDWEQRLLCYQDTAVAGIVGFSDGAFVVFGHFENYLVIDPYGDNPIELAVLESEPFGPQRDLFLVRFEADGTVGWTKVIGGSYADEASDIAALPDDSLVVAGRFGWNLNFSDDVAFGDSVRGEDGSGFVAKLSRTGDLIWAQEMWGNGEQNMAYNVAVDNNGNVYATGQVGYEARFAPGTPDETIYDFSAAYDGDAFIAKYDSNGRFLWADVAGYTGIDKGVAVDAFDDGSAVVAMTTSFWITFHPDTPAEFHLPVQEGFNDNDIVLVKYNSDGVLEWATDLEGSGQNSVADVIALSDGDFILGGDVDSQTYLDASWRVSVDAASGADRTFFFARYDENGYVRWAGHGGGADKADTACSLLRYGDQQGMIVGAFRETAVIEGGNGAEQVIFPVDWKAFYEDTDFEPIVPMADIYRVVFHF